ncbi:MAG TPA: DUF4142 domain-containing protein [Gemmatimonadales bacterium]|nr:DUF4142 domain-containing protein [Gemmatimonadales bacterium]
MRSHIIMAALLLAPGATLLAQDTSSTQMPPRDSIRGYNAPQSTGRSDSLPGDNALVMKIHRINQMEIKAGQLAQRNASNAKVKSYGQQLVRDHQAANQRLTTLAQRMGVTLKHDSAGQDSKLGPDRGRGQYGRDTTMRQGGDTTQGRYQQPGDTAHGRMGQHGDGAMHGHHQDAMKEHEQMQQQLQRLSTLRGAQFDAEFANFMAQGHDKAIKMLEQHQANVRNADLRTFITGTLPTLRTHLQVAQSLGGSTTTTATSSIQN